MSTTLRVAVCLYGGNARLPFEGGVALALTELVIASRRARGLAPEVSGFRWLDGLEGPLPDVHVDVISGASAGGIIGAVLGKMLTNSLDPEGDFAAAAHLFVEEMDFEQMKRDTPSPTAVFDKDTLTLSHFRGVVAGRDALTAAPLEPDAELWLALTHMPGLVELFELDDAHALEDVRYLEARRFDRIDFLHRQDALVEAVHATSANPLTFAPFYIDDLESPEGHAAWLRARAPYDPDVPDVRGVPAAPPPKVPVVDGGALDNRPLGEAIDAVFRRGAGIAAGEQLLFLLVDPNDETIVERFATLVDQAQDGARGKRYEDQVSSLLRTYEIIRHERITDDLRRLARWRDRVRVLARRPPRTVAPTDEALIEAADRIAFGGESLRMPGPAADLRLQLAYYLAGRARADPARSAALLSARRARSLLRLLRLWRAVERRRPAVAGPRLQLLTTLFEYELGHLAERVRGAAVPPIPALQRLIDEALLGAPRPEAEGPDPLHLTVRRIGPPPEGLATNEGEGFAGFLDRGYRAHDLIMGIIAGRRAVAELLPAEARARWLAHFALGESTDDAVRWFRMPPAAKLPWRSWLAGYEEVSAWRGRDWLTRPAHARADRENRRFYPATTRLAAYLSRRLWAMSIARVGKDHTIYRLARGVFALFSRALVPILMAAESRALAKNPRYTLFNRTRIAVVVTPVVYAGLCALLAALIVQVPARTALLWAAATVAVGLAPPFVAYLYWTREARLRQRAAIKPPDAAADPGDPPGATRSGGPAP